MDELLQRNKKNHYDFLIVGQGIAGSTLALTLIKYGYSVCIVDDSNLSTCSSVAAGIWNPIVFKRLVKSWKADDIIPVLINFYKDCEITFNTSLITDRNILKVISEKQEEDYWLKTAKSDNTYLADEIFLNLKLSNQEIIASYSKVVQAGNLNVVEFLAQTKKYITEHHHFLNEVFDFSEFKNLNTHIEYKSIIANQIVFCEGHLISKNPLFNWIPTKPAKGEVITIKCSELQLKNDILNKGIFILPLGNHLFKIGATYRWEDLNDLPTTDALIELETKLKLVLQLPYEIIKHEAGIRPSVIDRRPVVGMHPDYKNLFVFNGFGTKAVMLAPYFAKQLVDSIKNQSKVDDEVNPIRFKK